MVANLWTLDAHPTLKNEWSLEKKVKAIAAAGFDAVMAPATPKLASLLRTHRLRCLGFISSDDIQGIRRQVAAQRKAGAELINVQLGDGSTPPGLALRLTRSLLAEAQGQGIYAAIEVHRDTITETPEKTLALADALRRETGQLLPLIWDHSHPAVVKHLKPHLFSETLLRRPNLIRACRIMHLRPFNGQHAQVPVINSRGRLTPEFRAWREFARDLLHLWLKKRSRGELWVCPEIGPLGVHGYNLSTMESSWVQAKACARQIRHLWRELTRAS